MKKLLRNEIDGTKLVAGDLAKILNLYPMCDIDLDVEESSLLILNHTGYIIKKILFDWHNEDVAEDQQN